MWRTPAFAAIKYEREVGNAPYVFEHNGDGSFDVCEFLFEFFVHGDAFLSEIDVMSSGNLRLPLAVCVWRVRR